MSELTRIGPWSVGKLTSILGAIVGMIFGGLTASMFVVI